MLARRIATINKKFFHSSAKVMAEQGGAAPAATKVNLNLATPGESIYADTPVDLVNIPGLVGEYGVTAGHTPIIAQMKPGVITIHHEREKEVEKFFTAGGFAFTHENSTTDIACVELVKLEDLDTAVVQEGVAKYKSAMDSAAEGSTEKVEAQIQYETFKAMEMALSA